MILVIAPLLRPKTWAINNSLFRRPPEKAEGDIHVPSMQAFAIKTKQQIASRMVLPVTAFKSGNNTTNQHTITPLRAHSTWYVLAVSDPVTSKYQSCLTDKIDKSNCRTLNVVSPSAVNGKVKKCVQLTNLGIASVRCCFELDII